jgi:hypothetical protein
MMSDEEIEMWLKHPEVIENGAKITSKRQLLKSSKLRVSDNSKLNMTLQPSESFHKPSRPMVKIKDKFLVKGDTMDLKEAP